MDILEGNSAANSYTPHPCSSDDCDKGGCGFNPYAQGKTNYWAPGGTFITNDGTTTGTLTEIRRQYIQNGKVSANAKSSAGVDSIKEAWCESVDGAAATFGGLTTMGKALGRGMVLIFSIWNDNPDTHVVFSNIRWGDIGSTFNAPGGSGSSSSTTTSKATTTVATTKATSTTTKISTTTTAGGATQTQWGQCGGQGYTGPTACVSGTTCKAQNPYYSQCL
uniref:cellulase n=1 Tax=Penicillium oxalicum TaxID=69781 RepID=U3N108_PENOX|nr:endoglucanase 1 [Penicillium oxalicum]